MRVQVQPEAASNYVRRCYRHARPDCGILHMQAWQEKLEKVQGQWIDVETEHLFEDQFNTAPIPGVSENGLRLMVEDIIDIEDDVRYGVVKCQWCYGYDHNKDGVCDKCGMGDHLFELKPKVPHLVMERMREAERMATGHA